MIDEPVVQRVLGAALRTGGDFAEVFVEDRRSSSARLDDGKVEELTSGLDRGAGIPKDELPLVTRPFHRGKAAYDAVHQGAGVGLPFAKRIIDLHGGALMIESEEGTGTTVTVCLPLTFSAELASVA